MGEKEGWERDIGRGGTGRVLRGRGRCSASLDGSLESLKFNLLPDNILVLDVLLYVLYLYDPTRNIPL